jgi:hypothetical protein
VEKSEYDCRDPNTLRKDHMKPITGTHMGRLTDEARAKRARKNANRDRRDDSTGYRTRGAYRWATRLWLKGPSGRNR